ncbi:putative sensor with CHASE2 domain protein [Calothrix sp. NIES-4071]|nr:putative sensor with CHASE2 domain protein [Calothrix sp. NIES-4071]BAZ59645.1 putative sensor with CHASE2 domain protein [Calothrix sp. NIES-4105]
MSKLVVLKFSDGNFDVGFTVTLQIGCEGTLPDVEITGRLPEAPQLLMYYNHWRSNYERLGNAFRLSADKVQVTNVSITADIKTTAQILCANFNSWLQSDSFRPLREKWLEYLNITDNIRVILQTKNSTLVHLPWYAWDLLERYTKAEIAVSSSNYERNSLLRHTNQKVKILAIVGDSRGIDTQADRNILQKIPADITWMVESGRQELNDHLWNNNWDILFFAGHSLTHSDDSGKIYLNQTDSLSMAELRYALQKAVKSGLQLAIFNSCDGFGLARELACLQIPSIIFMREPIPDKIASEFLKYFLSEFASGTEFYLAVRIARERLQGLEDKFPSCTWLPMIYQNNPIQIPLTWYELSDHEMTLHQTLQGEEINNTASTTINQFQMAPRPYNFNLKVYSGIIAIVAFVLVVVRLLGLFETTELKIFDQMLWLRHQVVEEQPDNRIVMVTVDDNDLAEQRRKGESLKGTSISDKSLNILLEKLEQYQPAVIGLDIYRDFKSEDQKLTKRLQSKNLVAICKGSYTGINSKGIAPPPEIGTQDSQERLGFSDFIRDEDGIVRRQLLFMKQEPNSLCPTEYSLSLQLAFEYFKLRGISQASIDSNKTLKIANATFKALTDYSGGYQGIDANGGQVLLNWRMSDKISQQVSLTEILTYKVNPDSFKDKIVLIGVISKGDLQDYLSTPLGSKLDVQKPGVIIHAHMLSQILSHVLDNRSLLQTFTPQSEIIWIVSSSVVGGILTLRLRKQTRLIISITIATTILYILCFGLLLLSYWAPFVPSVIALSGTALIMSAFSTYVQID